VRRTVRVGQFVAVPVQAEIPVGVDRNTGEDAWPFGEREAVPTVRDRAEDEDVQGVEIATFATTCSGFYVLVSFVRDRSLFAMRASGSPQALSSSAPSVSLDRLLRGPVAEGSGGEFVAREDGMHRFSSFLSSLCFTVGFSIAYECPEPSFF